MNDVERIADLFEHRKGERLIWNGFKPNGKKKQIWEDLDIDWDLHFAGKLKQGGRLSSEDGTSKALVVDIDRKKDSPLIPSYKICEDAFKLDHTLQCFQSPSKNWHVYKFFHKAKSTKEVSKEAMNLGRAFKKLGYAVDFGKTLPKENGSQTGINFPFHTHQQPYDVRGCLMTKEQFLHAYRFQKFPLIKAATNLKEGEGGRPNTLLKIAAQLEQKNGMKYLDEVIKNFGDEFTDTDYIKRIKEKGIHKKYFMGPEGISTAITEIVGFDYEVKEPEPPPNFSEGSEEFEDIIFNKKETIKELVGYDIQEYINLDIEKPEFILEKLIKERTINFLFGAKGRGKTEFAMGIMNALTHGAEFLHYKAPYCYPVCYLDGEMDPYDIVERQNAYIKTWSNPPKNYLHVINFAHQIDQHIPDIKDELGQGLILKYLRKQEKLVGKKPLLILDNLRSLSNYKENDADSWRPIGVFLKDLRGLGFASLVLDHTGKVDPGPRGTSSKTDWANVCLKIESEGKKGLKVMKVKLSFDKARGLRPEDTEEFVAQYDFEGRWILGKSNKAEDNENLKMHIQQLLKKNPKPTQKEMSTSLNIAVGKVNKLMKEMEENKDSNEKTTPY